MSTDFHEHEVTFRMDEAFHIPWENGKSISHFCKRPVRTVIECTTKEPLKNWNLRTRMIFSESGYSLSKTIRYENKSVLTKRNQPNIIQNKKD